MSARERYQCRTVWGCRQYGCIGQFGSAEPICVKPYSVECCFVEECADE
jgi:hypothetical protein